MSDIERTPLANGEHRSKTGEILTRRDTIRARLARSMAQDPDSCECPTCVKNWEELG